MWLLPLFDTASASNVTAVSPLLSPAELRQQQHLSSYDAAYLELAMREGIPLATLDDDLPAAAGRVGVRLVDDLRTG
jgi:predicted nucleic acid-binding protein